jgi:hypothetical protein
MTRNDHRDVLRTDPENIDSGGHKVWCSIGTRVAGGGRKAWFPIGTRAAGGGRKVWFPIGTWIHGKSKDNMDFLVRHVVFCVTETVSNDRCSQG